MHKYHDFVLVKFENCDKRYLFHAPAWSHLVKGDEVMVETVNGVKRAVVISSITLEESDREAIDFVMNATGATPDVKRVLGKLIYKNFEWEEQEDESDE